MALKNIDQEETEIISFSEINDSQTGPVHPTVTDKERGHQTIVRRSNDLVQMTRNDLSLPQQKVMLSLLAMINEQDMELPYCEVTMYKFIQMMGKNPRSGKNYSDVKKCITDLANSPVQWIRNNGTDTIETFRWIQKAKIDKSAGKIKIEFDPVLKPHLIQLKSLYTTVDITYTLPMRSTYTVRIYELCKSYQNLAKKKQSQKKSLEWQLSTLYEQLNYKGTGWGDFKRGVLEKAKKEINGKTDIIFDYRIGRKESRAIKSIYVNITPVDEEEIHGIRDKIEKKNQELAKKERRQYLSGGEDVNNDEIVFDYVSDPSTSIPYSYGKIRETLKKELYVKARPEKLKQKLSVAEYNAVEVILDTMSMACCTPTDKDEVIDGGNATVFRLINEVILDCQGLTTWLTGVAPRYAKTVIPKAKKSTAPYLYLKKSIIEDLRTYKLYVFENSGTDVIDENPDENDYLEAEIVSLKDENDTVEETAINEKETKAPVIHLNPSDMETPAKCKKALKKVINEEDLKKILSAGQLDAYYDILDWTVTFCRRKKKIDEGMMQGKANMSFVNPLNDFIDRNGSLTDLFKAMATNLDFDLFWKEAAKNPKIKNPKALFQSEVEKSLLHPEMTYREYMGRHESDETASANKWNNVNWKDQFDD